MFALVRTTGLVGWQFIWVIFHLRSLPKTLATGSSGFPTGSIGELVFVAFIAVVIVIVIVAKHGQPAALRFMMMNHMRSIVTLPVPERTDPRLKAWKWNEEPLQ